jgi:hypothetical protein
MRRTTPKLYSGRRLLALLLLEYRFGGGGGDSYAQRDCKFFAGARWRNGGQCAVFCLVAVDPQRRNRLT